jgi:hypothetical protein
MVRSRLEGNGFAASVLLFAVLLCFVGAPLGLGATQDGRAERLKKKNIIEKI